MKKATEAVKMLWAPDCIREMNAVTREKLKKVLQTTSIVFPESFAIFIEDFLGKIKQFRNMIIRFESVRILYSLVITPQDIRLLKDYKEMIFKGEIGYDEEITVRYCTKEGLIELKNIFEEIFEEKEELLI
jgi:hypothetical protein